MKKKRATTKKILSGFNTALELRSVSGGARTDQKYQLEQHYQRLGFIKYTTYIIRLRIIIKFFLNQ